ncbi:EamA/RhaT family transporter [Desulfonema ishimotonii]|uniref:EamA/RhaT family transporter n=1 Tax=Desulfonema ishimotonii TaxID=45657 RepID=A0A401FU44_9BACT|nr:DMT family transporter [Desulfonema ishimotonii]GBC60507.1 EamA/RhaT family transporter [Desulfonema ishimotonii]
MSKVLTRTDYVSSPPFPPGFALIFGVFAVSTGAIFARLAGEAPALVIAAYRVGLASLVIIPFACFNARAELARISRRDLTLTLLSGFFLAMHFATWISSLDYTSVTNSVVLVNTNPLWVGLLTPFLVRERMRMMAVVSILISVIGGVVIGYGDFATGGDALWGDALALMGSICAAVYILLGRSVRKNLSLLAYVTVCYGSAALILWGIVLSLGLPVTGFSTQTTTAFWAMALIPQLIGHTSYNWSLKWFSASTIAVSLLGEPIGSTIMAWFLFDEGLTIYKIFGGALILFAIFLASLGNLRIKEVIDKNSRIFYPFCGQGDPASDFGIRTGNALKACNPKTIHYGGLTHGIRKYPV